MLKQNLGNINGYNSEDFFSLDEITRRTNKNGNSRTVTFNVTNGEDYHMYFCSSGAVHIKNNDAQTFTLKRYDLLIYQPKGHQEIFSEPGGYIHCVFSGKDVASILKSLNLQRNIVYHIMPSFESGKSFFFFNKQLEYVRSEYKSGKSHHKLSSTCMFIEFLILCSRHIETDSDNPSMNFIRETIMHITVHFAHELDINSFVEKSHLSKSRFYALFKEYTGTSPLRFQLSCRLTVAADYLIMYNYSVSHVSQMVGFKDPLYFSRLFKKEFGLSPTKYASLNRDYMPLQNKT